MVRKDYSTFGHVDIKMFQKDVVAIIFTTVATLLLCCGKAQPDVVKTATACYGNVNNYVRLECAEGTTINVIRVIHGAKHDSVACPSVASTDEYNRECCKPSDGDCKLTVLNAASQWCQGQQRCETPATWSTTNKECDQDEFPASTTYMLMEYQCLSLSTSSTTTTPKIRNSTASTPLVTVIPANTTTTTQKPSNTTTTKPVTAARSTGTASSDDELSDAMIGAIVGGSIGMMLTLVAFIFYWGRKRRLRIEGKHQTTVWDYLLSQTFTVRGARGYDHFHSIRSSASSDGDANSPVVRKNMWLPNIVHKDDERSDDIVSNIDNDTDKRHRVEIHHNAQPNPYAVLNLEVNNLYQNNMEV